jgi:hypothetical protein
MSRVLGEAVLQGRKQHCDSHLVVFKTTVRK